VGAGVAVFAGVFQLPVRARGAVPTLVFPLSVRTWVTLPALEFLPSMRAPLPSHLPRATTLRAHRLVRTPKRRGRCRGFFFRCFP
jgi:hypothetical protein